MLPDYLPVILQSWESYLTSVLLFLNRDQSYLEWTGRANKNLNAQLHSTQGREQPSYVETI